MTVDVKVKFPYRYDEVGSLLRQESLKKKPVKILKLVKLMLMHCTKWKTKKFNELLINRWT